VRRGKNINQNKRLLFEQIVQNVVSALHRDFRSSKSSHLVTETVSKALLHLLDCLCRCHVKCAIP